MLGVTSRLLPEPFGFWQLTRFLWDLVMTNRVPRGIREPAVVSTPTVSRVEGGFDTAMCVEKEC